MYYTTDNNLLDHVITTKVTADIVMCMAPFVSKWQHTTTTVLNCVYSVMCIVPIVVATSNEYGSLKQKI